MPPGYHQINAGKATRPSQSAGRAKPQNIDCFSCFLSPINKLKSAVFTMSKVFHFPTFWKKFRIQILGISPHQQ
jgi:hypothetical protein